MKDISVSIVVPVFNTGKLLLPCLRSLLSQTLENIEIILVDDGSNKVTRRICEKIANKFKDKIKLIRFVTNRRQGAARNEAIKVASGEYIGLVDSDDYVAVDMYEKLYRVAKSSQCDIVDSDRIELRKDGSERYITSTHKEQLGVLDFDKRKSLVLRDAGLLTKIIRKDIWVENSILYPEGIVYEDLAISGLHFMYAKKLGKVNEGLYFYRCNPNSTTHQMDARYLDRIYAAELFLSEYKKRGFYEMYRSEVEYSFVHFCYLNSYKKVVKYFSQDELIKLLNKVKLLCPNYRKNIYFKKKVRKKKRRQTYLLESFPRTIRCLWRIKQRVQQCSES